jgi:hypothetical protein
LLELGNEKLIHSLFRTGEIIADLCAYGRATAYGTNLLKAGFMVNRIRSCGRLFISTISLNRGRFFNLLSDYGGIQMVEH